MPNNDKVKMQTPDGKFWDVPSNQVSAMQQRFKAKLIGNVGDTGITGMAAIRPWERALVSRTGFDADKIATAGGPGAQWAETGREALSGLESLPSWILSILKDPLHVADPIANPLEQLGKDTPGIDPRKWNVPGAVGDLSSALAGTEFTKGVTVPSIKGAFNRPIRSAAQFAGGFGKDVIADAEAAHEANMANLRQGYLDDLRKATEEHGKKLDAVKSKNVDIEAANESARNAYQDKVQSIKDTYAKKVSDYLKARGGLREPGDPRAAAVKQVESAVKGKTFGGIPGGPAVQRLYSLADTAADHVKSVYRQTKAAMDSRWANLREMVGPDATVNWEPVQQAVITAEDNLLKGSQDNIKLFREIMGKDVIGRSVPYEQARGFFTELGEKLQSQTIPGDVWRALNYVRDTIDDEVGKTNKAVSPRVQAYYEQLKSDYSQYMKDFRDQGSPLRKLVEATNPKDRVSAISGKEGANAIDSLGRYTSTGANPGALGSVRDLFSTLRRFASSAPKLPDAPERVGVKFPSEPIPKRLVKEPEFTPPKEPVTTPFDKAQARLKILRSHKPGEVTPSRFLMYSLTRALLRKLARNPEIEKWLINNPE